MAAFITALTGTDGINETALWGGVTPAAPLVVTLVIFGFSYYVCRRVIKGARKARPTI